MGSTVKVKGVLKNFQEATNPGQFDAKSYYHILKISFQLNQTEIQGKSKKFIDDTLKKFERQSPWKIRLMCGPNSISDNEINNFFNKK